MVQTSHVFLLKHPPTPTKKTLNQEMHMVVPLVFFFLGKKIENLDKSAKFNIAKCPKFNLASAAKFTYNLASRFFKSHAECCKRIPSPLSTCKHHRSSKNPLKTRPRPSQNTEKYEHYHEQCTSKKLKSRKI